MSGNSINFDYKRIKKVTSTTTKIYIYIYICIYVYIYIYKRY